MQNNMINFLWRIRGRISMLTCLLLVSACMSSKPKSDHVWFQNDQTNLSAHYLALQSGKKAKKIVIFVHGDGGMTHDAGGYYLPIWEALLEKEYAVFSWDKPGVGQSSGNWLNQSMRDRQKEVLAAIKTLKIRYGYQSHEIGLMGFSQAGWVIPKIAQMMPDLGFIIGVGFAMNWQQQDWYQTDRKLQASGKTNDQMQAAYQRHLAEYAFLASGPSFSDYQLRDPQQAKNMSPDRFNFIKKNFRADADTDYAGIRQPFLMFLGAEDQQVDIFETQQKLMQIFGSQRNLDIRIMPQATHALLKSALFPSDQDEFETMLTFMWEGKSAFAPGLLVQLQEWIDQK